MKVENKDDLVTIRKTMRFVDSLEASKIMDFLKYKVEARIRQAGFPIILDGSTMTVKPGSISYSHNYYNWDNPLSFEEMLDYCNEGSWVDSSFDLYVAFTERLEVEGVDFRFTVGFYKKLPEEYLDELRALGKVREEYQPPSVIEYIAC